jgi:CDP-6-deoxy-D-xylo-4-hexulose-3-dehydrase
MPGEIFDHKYVYDEIGYNLKPIEMQGAMGLVQLEKLDTIHALRRRNYKLLFDIYSKYEEFFHLPRPRDKSDPSWFAFPLTIKDNAPFKRIDIVSHLEDNLIQTRPYFAGNLMLQPAYTHLMRPEDARNNFPVATKVMKDTFFHGTSPVITKEQIEYIGQKVDTFMSMFV